MATPIPPTSISIRPTLLHSTPPSTNPNSTTSRPHPFEHYKNQVIRLAERGQLDLAVKTLSAMPYKPDLVSSYVLLQSCIRDNDLYHGGAVHRLLLSSGVKLDTAISNSLITLYSKCGDYNMCYSLFSQLGADCDLFSWDTIITSAAQNGRKKNTLELFCKMLKSGFTPKLYIFCAVIKACSNRDFFWVGWVILASLIKNGSSRKNAAVVRSLIDMFAKNDDLKSARKVFDGISDKNVALWTQLITRYGQKGFVKEAIELFVEMLLDGKFEPDHFTLSSVLSSCADMGSIKLGRQFHAFAIKTGTIDLPVNCALIDVYAKYGNGESIEDARKVFDKMTVQNVLSWTALMSGYVQNGGNKEALDLFIEMILEGDVKPNDVTYSTILKACANLVDMDLAKQIHAHITKLGLCSVNSVGDALMSMYSNSGSMEETYNAFSQTPTHNMVSYSMEQV
ncbi:Pentatricopeptide repeat-containing protein [Rhynchospora pubera]|uniref:Pentatricopeptide repeat-containing protein n=1 Tax=Rhynchospora pubera TaxID=906938 RepID=A0AAV8FUS2_9POAL|nr:Pentatricopeptide repeat-containing protein [Rhynchospora pubera]